MAIQGILQPFRRKSPSLGGATGWLNSDPLTLGDLRGKVVLVNFWTYTCINWLRQLPYLRAWHAAYSEHGLVLIGVHTPEFGFERDVDNVARAVYEMDIRYPVALDSEYAVWLAFGNHYWPALYFVDADGRIRHHHFGEGSYERSERTIRQLLTAAGMADPPAETASAQAAGAEVAADWDNLQSPETYVGYGRSANFASPGGARPDDRHAYTAPGSLRLNHWALAGEWTITEEAATLRVADGRLTNRFHARDLHLVMGPAAPGVAVRFRVLIDGQPPGAAHGDDMDGDGCGAVTQQRLHQLVRQPGPIDDHTFEITFLDPGVQVFAFTYG